MKELSLYQKIAFAVLCVGAFTHTFALIPPLTVLRVVVVLVLCGLLFAERVRLDSAFYAICSFYFTYIVYTMAITLAHGRMVPVPDIANFLFILLMLIASLWYFCAAPRDSLKILYWICLVNLGVSFLLATVEITLGWHLPQSNMLLPEKIMIVEEYNKNLATGFFHNKNDFAIVVALTFCYILSYRIRFVKDRRWWADGILLLLCFGCLLMARSRTALIAVVLFLLFTQRRFFLQYKVFTGVAVAIGFIGAAVFLICSTDPSLAIRKNLYLYSFVSLFDSYGLGFGLGGDRYYFARLDNHTLFEYITNVHSYLLEFLLTSGIVFFVGYLLLLFWLMKRIARTKGRDEFWFMVPLYVFLLFAPSSSLHLWIHYLFFSAMVGYALIPTCQNETMQNREYAL